MSEQFPQIKDKGVIHGPHIAVNEVDKLDKDLENIQSAWNNHFIDDETYDRLTTENHNRYTELSGKD